MEAVLWSVLGLTILISAPLARRHPRARQVGVAAVGVLFLLAGALINLIYLIGDTDYATFADTSMLAYVRETWRSVVAPRQELFIGLLVVGEALIGILVLLGGRRRQLGLAAAIAFHVALLPFGWFFWVWSLPMIAALVALLRAERSTQTLTSRELSAWNGSQRPTVGKGVARGSRRRRTTAAARPPSR